MDTSNPVTNYYNFLEISGFSEIVSDQGKFFAMLSPN